MAAKAIGPHYQPVRRGPIHPYLAEFHRRDHPARRAHAPQKLAGIPAFLAGRRPGGRVPLIASNIFRHFSRANQ
jgi:hypothetical protein